MTDPLRIFVSHSSIDKDLTEDLCLALRGEEAGQAGYETVVDYDVLVDMDELQAGMPWPKQLHEWMARCHAAVLLLTANAVQSPWVLKEATILAWRLSLDSTFRFVTVRFDDVKDEDLKAGGFDPLMLGEIQTIPGQDAGAIAAEVRKTIGSPAIEETPYDLLCGALEDLAEDIKDNTLRRIAEKIQVAPPQWRPGNDTRQQYVQAIARKLICENLGGFEGVDDLVNTLMATTRTETVEKILYIVAPYWVDAGAAGRLPLFANIEPRRAVAMNGVDVVDFTAEMYVRRSHPLSRLERILYIPGGNSGDILDHVTRELYWHAHRDDRTGEEGSGSLALSEAQLEDVTKFFSRDKPRYFVVLSRPHPLGTDLKELMKRFPKLSFILWTGEELLELEPETVVRLEPPVDIDEEERQMQAFQISMEIIRGG